MLPDFPAKEHRGPFVGGRFAFRHDLEFLYVAEGAISILHQHTADHRPHFLQRVGADATLGNHQPQVFFLRKNGHGLVAEARRDDHLREDLGNGLRQLSVERLIDDDDPTKRCLPISGVGLFPRRQERVCARDAARVRMLQDGHRRSLKLTDQVSSRRDVQNIIVGQFLALKLRKMVVERAVERRLLMRILPVAKGLRFFPRQRQRRGQSAHRLEVGLDRLQLQIARDRRIVTRGALKHLERELAAEFEQTRRISFPSHRREHRVVVSRVAHHAHTLVILGRAAQHRGTADVDIFDRLFEMNVRFRHGFLEGIEVHDDEIDQLDGVGLRLREVVGLVAPAEQSAVNLRVQCLDPTFHDFRKPGVLADLRHRQTALGEQFRRAAGREQGVAVRAHEHRRELHQTTFVADREQGKFHHNARFCAAPRRAARPKNNPRTPRLPTRRFRVS